MRFFLTLIACVIGAIPQQSAMAEWGCSQHTQYVRGCAECANYEASCEAIPYRHRQPCSCQSCKQPCQPAPQPQQQLAPPFAQEQQGVFVQPPPTGTTRGPVNQMGIEGLELRFPEFSLRLPSLRLPALSRFRQDARMEIESARAPFQQNQVSQAVLPSGQMLAAPQQQMALVQPQMTIPQTQQYTIPLNITAAPPAPQSAGPSPQELADLLRQLDVGPPPPRPPQDQVSPPTCSTSDLQREVCELRLQIQQLQNSLRTPCRVQGPNCDAAPSWEPAPAPTQAPGQGTRAPWPTPVPDESRQQRPRYQEQPAVYSDPTRPQGPTQESLVLDANAPWDNHAPVYTPQPTPKPKSKKAPTIKGLR